MGDTVLSQVDALSYLIVNVVPTGIPDVLIIEPQVFEDERGFFFESFNQQKFTDTTGLDCQFVQDNHSRSRRNVLRGLHYQIQQVQDKLVNVICGEIYDVVVDIRRSSATFGQWVGIILSAENKRQLWVPAGFAHGFYVLSELADVVYKTTDYYAPQYERSIVWNDSKLAIDWPLLKSEPVLSAKDKLASQFAVAEVFD